MKNPKGLHLLTENNRCMELFKACMDEGGIEYQTVEDNVVCIIYKGENLPLIPIWFFFYEDETPLVEVKCWDIVHVRKEKRMTAYRVCNEMNRTYRLFKETLI